MPYERNPSIPPPPPPPGSKNPAPTPQKIEGRENKNLTEVEKVLFKNSAEYGNLSPEQAQMTPKLREILGNFRKDRLFAIEAYVLSGGGDGHPGGSTYDNKALKIGKLDIYNDIDPSDIQSRSIEYKMKQNLAKAVAFTPMQKRDKKIVDKVVRPAGWFNKEIKEQVTEYGPPRPMRFEEAFSTASTEIAKDPVVRITYHASDPRDQMRYACDTRMDVSWRKTRDRHTPSISAYEPEPITSDPAQNINAHMKDILHVPQVKPSWPRPGNQVAISLILPQSRARELWDHFQKNPEYIRPFFIAGAEDLMPLHLPPPYKEWDKELPNKPVLFREFDGSKKEVKKAFIPSGNK